MTNSQPMRKLFPEFLLQVSPSPPVSISVTKSRLNVLFWGVAGCGKIIFVMMTFLGYSYRRMKRYFLKDGRKLKTIEVKATRNSLL